MAQEVMQMSSPFPSMDPYIEDPEVWSDFHGGLADEMRAQLNSVLQPCYVARLTPRYVARLTPRVIYDLRGGERPPLAGPVPSAPYYVTLSRAHRRPVVEVWPIQLWEKLPVIPVPLLDPDPDVPLDLGTVVTAVYERGAYARLIDYRLPPPPPNLPEVEAAWLDKYLRAQQAR